MTIYLIPTVLAEQTAESVLPKQISEVVLQTQYYLVENIRTARRFISSLRLGIEIELLHFEVVDKSTPESDVLKFLSEIPADQNVGIMSEAGCPGIADPGSVVVKIAHQKGIKVVPLVGPSSILMALISSGFSGQHFAFNGYLPINKEPKLSKIRDLEQIVLTKGITQIFMETPFRSQFMFEDILKACSKNIKLCIATDITGPSELILTKEIGEWRKTELDINKKPTIFILGR